MCTEARAKGALIIYSVAVPKSVPADILKELTPAAGEQVLPPLGPDKFINSDLEKTLKAKGIKTVVAMGTQAQTSVLHTGGEAALRGFNVIVPVDGMSADNVFPELYTAWHLDHRGADQRQGDADPVRHDQLLAMRHPLWALAWAPKSNRRACGAPGEEKYHAAEPPTA